MRFYRFQFQFFHNVLQFYFIQLLLLAFQNVMKGEIDEIPYKEKHKTTEGGTESLIKKAMLTKSVVGKVERVFEVNTAESK